MDRQTQYKKMYETMTLQEIGDKEGISAERVRQIIEGSNVEEIREQLIKDYSVAILDMDEAHIQEEIARLAKPDREKETVEQRRILINYLIDVREMSVSDIANLLNRDYSTIVNMLKKGA